MPPSSTRLPAIRARRGASEARKPFALPGLELSNSSIIFRGWIFDMVHGLENARRLASRRGEKQRILGLAENCGKSPPPNR
jgi:hypothetical protein